MPDTYCKHCGRGKWNPETGTRAVRFWIAPDETTEGVEILRGGAVVIDVAMGTVRLHDRRARALAHKLAAWLGDKYVVREYVRAA